MNWHSRKPHTPTDRITEIDWQRAAEVYDDETRELIDAIDGHLFDALNRITELETQLAQRDAEVEALDTYLDESHALRDSLHHELDQAHDTINELRAALTAWGEA